MENFLPDMIRDAGYWAVYLLMLVESFLPIFPTEVVIPLAGVFAANGKMTLPGVIAAGTLGSLTGSSMWYAFARALGYKRFRHVVTRFGWITTLTEHEVEKLQRWFERFGPAMVFFGRFIPGVRNLVSIPAGLIAMPYPKFLLLSALGVSLSNTIFATGGWMLRGEYHRIEHWVGPVTTGIIALLVAIWLLRVVIGLVRRRQAASSSADNS
jgi:membrane protein DedA with SNARE-associated domain